MNNEGYRNEREERWQREDQEEFEARIQRHRRMSEYTPTPSDFQKYSVQVPVTGSVWVDVDGFSEDHAMEKAIEMLESGKVKAEVTNVRPTEAVL